MVFPWFYHSFLAVWLTGPAGGHQLLPGEHAGDPGAVPGGLRATALLGPLRRVEIGHGHGGRHHLAADAGGA